ncbi:MAG: hypothetical protein LBH03_04365 [Holophagales bacterium]|nr:hypothetical protein [Holophagales bacterium]
MSDQLTNVFVEGFAHDTYSANLPFSSHQLKDAMEPVRHVFIPGSASYYSVNIIEHGIDAAHHSMIHEVGHHLGLSENLAALFSHKYFGRSMNLNDSPSFSNLSVMSYSPFYDNMLLNMFGDKIFWAKVYESPINANARYNKFWDENITVVIDGRKEPLVSARDMCRARMLQYLIHFERGRDRLEFLQYMGFGDWNLDDWKVHRFFSNLGSPFENAIKTNDPKSIQEVREFFGIINDFANDKNTSFMSFMQQINVDDSTFMRIFPHLW